MSNHHAAGVCCQCESFGVSGPGTSLVRSTVEADAAKPHRAGVSPRHLVEADAGR